MSHRATGLALVAVVAGMLGGCGGGGGGEPQARPLHQGNLELADCTDWRAGSVLDRRATVVAIRGFYSSRIGSGQAGTPTARGAVLDNQRAYDLFQGWCARSYAAGFKLYKLYGRAAAFVGVTP